MKKEKMSDLANAEEHVLFSVVVVAYGKSALVRQCLNSVSDYNDLGDRVELIVVDNSPTDEVMRMVSAEFPQIRYIKNDNHGFGEGNNRGISVSRGQFLLLLNPDAALISPVFRHAVEAFSSNRTLAAFGVQLVDRAGRKEPSFFWAVPGGILKGLGQQLFTRLGVFLPFAMCTSGAALFLRRAAFEDVGGFDERMFLYCEEPDLWFRLVRNGWSWRFYPRKQIMHSGAGTTSDDPQFVVGHRLKSLEIFCTKNGRDFQRQLAREMRYERFRYMIARLKPRATKERLGHRQLIIAQYQTALTGTNGGELSMPAERTSSSNCLDSDS